ncbi:MAG: type II secretion system F family protein [Lachnospiraceae bacterium]|nr:type II secretion system F family protein [Lachnospiraceae bacterium]
MKQRIGIAIAVIIAIFWLLFDFDLWGLAVFFVLPFYIMKCKKDEKEQNKWQITLEFKDMLELFTQYLQIGNSAEQSVKRSLEGIEKLHGKSNFSKELKKVCVDISVGKSLEAAFQTMADNSSVEEISYFAGLLETVRRKGGNIDKLTNDTLRMINDKIDITREKKVLLASKKFEIKIMTAMPFAMTAYVRFGLAESSVIFYHNPFGICFMYGILAVWYLTFILSERVVENGI